jgi:hypothetical protein
MLGAAHKPGAVPLRPLGLGDIYDAAFKIIRFNPTATVGAAVLVAAVTIALPALVTGGLTAAIDDSGIVADLIVYADLGIGAALQYFGAIFVTGMVVHVAAAAAIGRRLSLGEAWAATGGTRWRLVGLATLVLLILVGPAAAFALLSIPLLSPASALTVVWFVVGVPALLALTAWLWIRVTYLAAPALMIERTGVIAAIRRGYALTRGQFWRTFGIGLLTSVVTGVAASILTVPFAIMAAVLGVAGGPSDGVLVISVVVNALGAVVSSAFVTPFTAAVTSLQYLDQRIRKEAYDVELMTQAGIIAP